MSQNISAEYLQLFINTAKEALDTLSSRLKLLNSDNELIKPDAVSESHRMAHTLKSSSHFMGYTHLSEAMLVLENLFNGIKNGSLVLSSPMIEIIDETINQAKNSISSIENEGQEIDLTYQVTLLKKFIT